MTEVEPRVHDLSDLNIPNVQPSRGPIRHSRPSPSRAASYTRRPLLLVDHRARGGAVLWQDLRHLWAWDSVADLQEWVDQNPLGEIWVSSSTR